MGLKRYSKKITAENVLSLERDLNLWIQEAERNSYMYTQRNKCQDNYSQTSENKEEKKNLQISPRKMTRYM